MRQTNNFHAFRFGDGCLNIVAFVVELLLILFMCGFCSRTVFANENEDSNIIVVTYVQGKNNEWLRITDIRTHNRFVLHVEFEDEVISTENKLDRFISYKLTDILDKPVVWFMLNDEKFYVRDVYVIKKYYSILFFPDIRN